jgi:hypothetical protein
MTTFEFVCSRRDTTRRVHPPSEILQETWDKCFALPLALIDLMATSRAKRKVRRTPEPGGEVHRLPHY